MRIPFNWQIRYQIESNIALLLIQCNSSSISSQDNSNIASDYNTGYGRISLSKLQCFKETKSSDIEGVASEHHMPFGGKIQWIQNINHMFSWRFRAFCAAQDDVAKGALTAYNKPFRNIPVQDSFGKYITDSDGAHEVYIHYDYRTKQPKYTYEKFIKQKDKNNDKSNKLNRKGMTFYTDNLIPGEHFKVRTKDYTDSGYDRFVKFNSKVNNIVIVIGDRGHMIPAADLAYDHDLYAFTFSMLNISPQNPDLNKVYWAKFEAWLRYLYERGDYEEYEVITGPAFCPSTNMSTGQWAHTHAAFGPYPRLIAVPTHYFKVVRGVRYAPLGQSKDSRQSLQQVVLGCFLIPNINISSEVPISTFMIKLNNLESLTGLRFFEGSLSDNERLAIDKLLPDTSLVESIMQADAATRIGMIQKLINEPAKQLEGNAKKPQAQQMAKNTKNESPIIHLCQAAPCYQPFFQKN